MSRNSAKYLIVNTGFRARNSHARAYDPIVQTIDKPLSREQKANSAGIRGSPCKPESSGKDIHCMHPRAAS
jgi:hypothetical protein